MATPPPRPSRFFDGLVAAVLVVAIAGHAVRVWDLPRIDSGVADLIGTSAPSTATFNPRAVTVVVARSRTAGFSPWPAETVAAIRTRTVERWSEATLGRSQIIITDGSQLADVFIVFNDVRLPSADARQVSLFGGRLRYIDVSAPLLLRIDQEGTVETLVHELGHALGCCQGAGTVEGHWVGCADKIMCSRHGNARRFAEEELRQMGLGG